VNSNAGQESENEVTVAERKAYDGGLQFASSLPIEPPADIGVLLVHGIGNHREGVTLRAFGQPMLDWLKEWLRGRDDQSARGNVEVTQARFNDIVAPAYALVEVTSADGTSENKQTEKWLFCEGWWGATVQSPVSLKLLQWMWMRAPLLIYWHFYIRQTSTAQSIGQKARNVIFAFVAFLLVGFAQFVITIALVLSLIPIGPWRRKIVKALRVLTLTLGDSYVLEEGIQRAALIERVRFALGWLAARAKNVVIIAHSQGGAIAHEVLRVGTPPNLAIFFTVGSGLEKLQFLREVGTDRRGLAAAALIFPFVACGVAILVSAFPSGPPWEEALGMLLVVIATGLSGIVLHYLRSYRKRLYGDVARLKLAEVPAWFDFYASDDVVPMNKGSLLEDVDFVTREKVHNERSYLRDHVCYFTNFNDCLPRLWIYLSKLSRLPIINSNDMERLVRFSIAHAAYTHVISFSRLALFLGLFLGAFALRDSLLVFGKSIVTTIEGTPVADWLKPIRTVAKLMATLVQRWWKPHVVSADAFANGFFGAAVLLLAIALWWIIFRSFWLSRCRARWRRACYGGDIVRTSRDVIRTRIACIVFTAIGSLPLIISVILTINPRSFTVDRMGSVIAMAAACMSCLLAFVIAVWLPWLIEAAWRNRAQGSTMAPVTTPIILICWAYAWLPVARWLWPSPIAAAVQEGCIALFLMTGAIAGQVYGVTKISNSGLNVWATLLILLPVLTAVAGIEWLHLEHSWLVGGTTYLASTVLVLGLCLRARRFRNSSF
jgi:hypothetical protein